MDKILLTAFLTAFAGFITAALSIVKLVNEKESKTTDYRQQWTESVRESLAELIGKLNSFASLISQNKKTEYAYLKLESAKISSNNTEHLNSVSDLVKKIIQDAENAERETLKEIYHAYSKSRLHFKVDDDGFRNLEHKFDLCISKADEIRSMKFSENSLDETYLKKLEWQIYTATSDMSDIARQLLKREWETVKKGEPAYKNTKRWSFISLIFMCFILLTIGIHAGISHTKSATESSSKVSESSVQTASKNSQ